MPSPVGHSLAGLCGFLLGRKELSMRKQTWLLVGSVALANLPDLDFIPGLWVGDPRVFHHQGAHSLAAAVLVGLTIGLLSWFWKSDPVWWGIWGGSIYLSHVLLDLMVNDPSPPFGAQVFWPFSSRYFISPFTPFSSFDYYDPDLGIIRSILSLHNIVTVLREFILMLFFVFLSWYIGRKEPSSLERETSD
jgi:inner membrane protein